MEALKTHATLLLPLVEAELTETLIELGLGASSQAHASMFEAALSVASYALANQGSLVSLDVNPVIITTEGRAIAADALIELKQT